LAAGSSGSGSARLSEELRYREVELERLRDDIRAKDKRVVQLTFEVDKAQLQTRQQVAHATDALKTQNMLLSKEVRDKTNTISFL
jgi:hypothetical protein